MTDDLKKELESVDFWDKKSYIKMKGYEPTRQFTPEYVIEVPTEESTLIFDSRFESGNLRKAIRVSDIEYNLLLEYDTETTTYT